MRIRKNDLILLNSISDFGYKKLNGLLDRFGNTTQIVKSFPKKAFNIKNIEHELKLIDKKRINTISVFDEQYPYLLKQISSPPIILYVEGNIDCLNDTIIAVVGSRNCTPYGISMTKKLCSVFAESGITVVSGMARGIDTAAHRQALDFSGKTVAVLGSGLDNIYPSQNKPLAKTISKEGALISEFPMNTLPLRHNFPRRNRIISGLSKGVVVVEAREKSGALITANFALDQNRDVFAVPGKANSDYCKGCNSLIKQGAKITCEPSDVIDEIFPELLNKAPQKQEKENSLDNIPSGQRIIFDLLSDEPLEIDVLTEKLNINSQQALPDLLQLELSGLIKQLPGKLYIRN